MSYDQKTKTTNKLVENLKGFLPANTHDADVVLNDLIEVLDAYVDARIDDAIDRLYNRGDYRG